jgi:hypothetical protein
MYFAERNETTRLFRGCAGRTLRCANASIWAKSISGVVIITSHRTRSWHGGVLREPCEAKTAQAQIPMRSDGVDERKKADEPWRTWYEK